MRKGPNEYFVQNGVVHILINRRDQVLECLVDESDLNLVKEIRWKAQKGSKTFYACSVSIPRILMHRLLLGSTGDHIDHDNFNGLDNRRCNIYPSTHARNLLRRTGLNSNNTTGVLGVTIDRVSNPKKPVFVGQFMFHGRHIHVGRFVDLEMARVAVEAKRRELLDISV
jgi:hypothetical protein